jgi:hypothetical protein
VAVVRLLSTPAPGTHVAFPHGQIDSTTIAFCCSLCFEQIESVAGVPRCSTFQPARSRPLRLPEPFSTKKASQTRRAPNIGPIHDVFVDTDPFDSCDHPPPNKHKQSASLRSRAYRRAAALRTALLAEFAHRRTPVTTCIPLPHSGLHTRPLLTTTPGAWVREQRWLQAALEILRW